MKQQWNKDLNFSEKMSFLVDSLLKTKIPKISEIKRLKSENGQVHELDINFAIDGIIEKESGVIYTFQEKIRREKFKKYDDFTIEYYSNVDTKTKGEFFHLCTDFYLHGYANKSEDDLLKLRILDVKKLKRYIDKNFDKLLQNNLKQNNRHSRANFFTISFKELENKGIVLKTIENKEKLTNRRKLKR